MTAGQHVVEAVAIAQCERRSAGSTAPLDALEEQLIRALGRLRMLRDHEHHWTREGEDVFCIICGEDWRLCQGDAAR